MSILLMILKIIGITILCIIGLFILLVLAFLFCPLRYTINGFYKDKIYARAEFHWLFNSYRGFVEYKDNKLNYSISILFWKVFPIDRDKIENKAKKKSSAKKSRQSTKNKDKNVIKSDDVLASADSDILNDAEVEIKKEESPNIKENVSEEKHENNESKPEKATKLKKCTKNFRKVLDFFVHIKYSLLKICDKIKEVINNLSFYVDLLNDDNTKRVIEKTKDLFFKAYQSMKPQKLSIKLRLGFKDDPELEGKLLMIHGLAYPIHNGKIELVPDFETDTREAEAYVKGKLKAIVFIKFVHLFMFDKDLRRLKEVLSEK